MSKSSYSIWCNHVKYLKSGKWHNHCIARTRFFVESRILSLFIHCWTPILRNSKSQRWYIFVSMTFPNFCKFLIRMLMLDKPTSTEIEIYQTVVPSTIASWSHSHYDIARWRVVRPQTGDAGSSLCIFAVSLNNIKSPLNDLFETKLPLFSN